MKSHVSVKDLVLHTMRDSAEVFKGTTHEDDWVFYHDALVQMTDKATVAWMKEIGVYHRWLTPSMGLNDGTVYANRPPGNSPEMMPLDCSLNKDIDDVVARHIAYTHRLDEEDNLKFSRSTVKRQSRAYLRLFDPKLGVHAGVPCSKRIVEDVDRCFGPHLLSIFRAFGAAVHGLGSRQTRNGHRKSKVGGWGGKRVKSAAPSGDIFVHEDAQKARADFAEHACALADAATLEFDEFEGNTI